MAKILPLWWAWQWRVVVAIFLANFLFGFVFAFKPLLGISKESFIIITNIFSLGVTIYASIYFLDVVLKKRYKKFRVVLMDEVSDPYKLAARK